MSRNGLGVLLVGEFGTRRSEYIAALTAAGMNVVSHRTLAALECWPDGHVVVASTAYATGWWKRAGATHLVVIGRASDAPVAADHVLRGGAPPEELVATVLACFDPA